MSQQQTLDDIAKQFGGESASAPTSASFDDITKQFGGEATPAPTQRANAVDLSAAAVRFGGERSGPPPQPVEDLTSILAAQRPQIPEVDLSPPKPPNPQNFEAMNPLTTAEAELGASQRAGEILATPITGARRAVTGAARLMGRQVTQPSGVLGLPQLGEAHAAEQDAIDVLDGSMQALSPFMVAGLYVAPIRTALAIGTATAAGVVAREGVLKAGGSADDAHLAQSVVSAAVGAGVGSRLIDSLDAVGAKAVEGAKAAARPVVLASKLTGSGFGVGDVPGARLAPYADAASTRPSETIELTRQPGPEGDAARAAATAQEETLASLPDMTDEAVKELALKPTSEKVRSAATAEQFRRQRDKERGASPRVERATPAREVEVLPAVDPAEAMRRLAESSSTPTDSEMQQWRDAMDLEAATPVGRSLPAAPAGAGEWKDASDVVETPVGQPDRSASEDSAAEKPREFSSTQVQLPPETASGLQAIAAKIPDEDPAKDGRQEETSTSPSRSVEARGWQAPELSDAQRLEQAIIGGNSVEIEAAKQRQEARADVDVARPERKPATPQLPPAGGGTGYVLPTFATTPSQRTEATTTDAAPPSSASRVVRLFEGFKGDVEAGTLPKDPRELRKLAASRVGGDPTTYTDEITDAVEAALTHAVTLGGSYRMQFAQAQALEAQLPRASRSLEKSKLQQFSTPLPLAVSAAQAADVQDGDVVLEPTAGTGHLVATIDPATHTVRTNELSPRRAELLKALGYQTTQKDYLSQLDLKGTADVIITNPPWGKYTTGKYGKPMALGFEPGDVAERFIAKNIRDLKPGGRIVAVMPTTMLGSSGIGFRKMLAEKGTVRALIQSPPGAYRTRSTDVDSLLLVWDQGPPAEQAPLQTPADWEAYTAAVEAIPPRETVRAEGERPAVHPADRRPAAAAAPAPGAERPSPRRPADGGGERRPVERGTPVVPEGRNADVVAAQPGAERGGLEPERAPERAARPTQGESTRGLSPSALVSYEHASASPFFAPYRLRTDLRGVRHPKLVVEARNLAGIDYPALTLQPTARVEKLVADGRASIEQAEQALAVVQANIVHHHGYLAADNVGVGKSREIALAIIDLMERAKADGRPLRLLVTTKSADNINDLVDRELKDAVLGGEAPGFEIVRVSDLKASKQKTGDATFEPLPQFEHAIYVTDFYNLAPFREALKEVGLHGILGDEAHRFKNADAAVGGTWQTLHAAIMAGVPRNQQVFGYFSATPAQSVYDYQYLYGLRLWPIDGFHEWVMVVTGQASQDDATELAAATAQGAADIQAVAAGHDTVVGGDAEDVAQDTRGQGAEDVFASHLTPSEAEQIPREWKMQGRFSARDLWREGTEFQVHTAHLPTEAKDRYDRFAKLARDIIDAAAKFGRMDKSGKANRFGPKAALQAAAKRIQMQPALEEAIRLGQQGLTDGYQIVLSVINVSEMDPNEGNIAAAINQINTREVEKDDDGGFTDVGAIPEALIARAELLEQAQELGSLPDPIEMIAEAFGREKVAFIVGASAGTRQAQAKEFQEGKRQVAVISAAGSTGISLDHRVRTKGGAQGRRLFIDVQYEWSASEAVQRYGRVDRAAQVSAPKILALNFGSASEKKFLATVANRMASLGALSKGGAESTGANALEEFEITGNDALQAARNAWAAQDYETRDLWKGSPFRDPRALSRPAAMTRASMREINLALLWLPTDIANTFWEAFVAERARIREAMGYATEARTKALRGEVLRETRIAPDLMLFEVKNEAGHRFGILQGVVMAKMPRLRDHLYDADGNVRRSYVNFTDTVNDRVVSGLEIAPTRIKGVAAEFGTALQGEAIKTPEQALAALKAGDTLTLGYRSEGSARPWQLRQRKDEKVVIDGAKMADRDLLLRHGATYSPVGNFWHVVDMGTFLERFPVAEPSAGVKEKEHEIRPVAVAAVSAGVQRAAGSIAATLSAPTVDRSAKLSARYLRWRIGQMVHLVAHANDALGPYRNAFEKLTVDHAAVLDIADAIENPDSGKRVPPWLQPWVKIRTRIFDHLKQQIKELGVEKEWRAYYLGHIWETEFKGQEIPQDLLSRLIGRRPLQGPKSFLKRRTIPTMREGVERFKKEPKTWNLIDIDLYKMEEMAKYILGRESLRDNLRMGTWVFQTALKKAPDRTLLVPIPDPIGEVWAPPAITVREAYDKLLMEGLESFIGSLGVRYTRKPTSGARWGATGDVTGDITAKFGGPEGVLMHEIGHALNARFGLYARIAGVLKTPAFVGEKSALGQLKALATLRYEGQTPTQEFAAYVQSHDEQIANLVHAYLYAPEKAKAVALDAYDALQDLIDTTPELEALGDLQQMRSLVLGQREATHRLAGPVLLGRYYAPPSVARLFKNYLTPGLTANRAWSLVRIPANAMVQAKLMLSAFHAWTISIEQAALEAGRGVSSVLRGQLGRGAKQLGRAVAKPVTGPIAGRAISRRYRETLDPRSLAVHDAVNLAIMGGGRVEMSREYSNRSIRRFMDALRRANGAYERGMTGRASSEAMRAVLHGLPALVEAVSYPILQVLVPAAKVDAATEQAASELAALPGEPTEETVLAVAQKAVNLVDASLGEVVWDNYFLPRALMSVIHMLIMAPGWRGGSAVILARGVTDPIRRLAPSQRDTYTVRVPVAGAGGSAGAGGGPPSPTWGKRAGGPDQRTIETQEPYWSPYTSLLIATTLMGYLVAELYQLAHGAGHVRSPKDAAFPRTGEVNPNGQPERVRLPGYTGIFYDILRDLPRSAVEYALGGEAPFPTLMWQLWHNETRFGDEIVDHDDPWRKELLEYAKFLKDEFEPISVGSYGRRAGTPVEKAESVAGISPAPARITRTDAENYLHESAPPPHRTVAEATERDQKRAIREAVRSGDGVSAAMSGAENLSPRQRINAIRTAKRQAIESSFNAASFPQALKAYQLATPEERALTKGLLAKKLSGALVKTPDADRAALVTKFHEAMALPTALH